MSGPRGQYLLATFIALLAAHGLAPEQLDPWRGWVTFKEFAREVREEPDPGITVQITSAGPQVPVRLYFMRQVLVRRDEAWDPVGGVVCEFWFSARDRLPAEWDAWSFDLPTFERFVDLVEQHPAFADLLTQRPVASAVYWEAAT